MLYYILFFFWFLVTFLLTILSVLSFFIDTAFLSWLFFPPLFISMFWRQTSKKIRALKHRQKHLFYRDTPKLFNIIITIMTPILVISFMLSMFYSANLPDFGRVSCDETTQVVAEASCWYNPVVGRGVALFMLTLSIIEVGLWYPFCWGKNAWIYRGDK